MASGLMRDDDEEPRAVPSGVRVRSEIVCLNTCTGCFSIE